ncbi:hypothetical protein ACH4VX_19130 [Streptomyces sp. NPDC020731]|uniref:hypothetical protein n=1 Tax=Streptomyces sp. NPDC020731 TaxID=3365085 RepID=UPI0037904D15
MQGVLPAGALRNVPASDLHLGLPPGLSPVRLFTYVTELNVQPGGLPPALLLIEHAAEPTPSQDRRLALSAWASGWARPPTPAPPTNTSPPGTPPPRSSATTKAWPATRVTRTSAPAGSSPAPRRNGAPGRGGCRPGPRCPGRGTTADGSRFPDPGARGEHAPGRSG